MKAASTLLLASLLAVARASEVLDARNTSTSTDVAVVETAKPTPEPQIDESVTCIGEGVMERICCRNCSSCCKERKHCNVGSDNQGWGNLGHNNRGDFNFANNSLGDCNVGDESYGIGGPEYSGCPQETWDHIVRFCTIYPYYYKCHSPPIYFGEQLADLLAAAALGCDGSIKITRVRQQRFARRRERRTRVRGG